MAEKSTSLATAIVMLFNRFYKVYLETENGCESFSGEKLNIDEDKETICIYYNSIAEQLDGIGIDEKRKIEFQTELDSLPSDDLKLFLGNLLDFIKAYKLDTLKDFYQCKKTIECMLILNQSVSVIKNQSSDDLTGITTILKKISDLNGINSILNKINENKGKFTNAEKYLADLIIAVGKGNIKDIYIKLGNLKKAYLLETFFKDEQEMKLVVKTVKELGITEEYGKSMKKINIGRYYKKMSFENSDLVTKGKFKSWTAWKNYIDSRCKAEVKIDNKTFNSLENLKTFMEDTNNVGFNEIKWDNKTFKFYKNFEKAFFEKIFTDHDFLKKNKISEISENDKKLIKELYLMDSPHAHHVLYKGWENNRIWRWKNESEEDFEKRKAEFNANNKANKDLDEKIRKARKVLWEYDIDPYVGLENLCWAPNVNPDQHNDEHIRIIAEELIALHEKKCSRDDVIEYLEKMKDIAKDLWKNYNKGEK